MHVISRQALKKFWQKYPDSQNALIRWYKIMTQNDLDTFQKLRVFFPSADMVDKWVVFNIGGNKYRLITSIHFNRHKVYIRHILTHSEYDRESWKT